MKSIDRAAPIGEFATIEPEHGRDEQHDRGEARGAKQGHASPSVGRSRRLRRPGFPARQRPIVSDDASRRDTRDERKHRRTTVERMRELTQTEAIDLVGRFEAGQEIPERMRADVRMLGSLLGRVLRESGSPGLFEDVERLRVATIQAYTDETPEAFARAAEIADSFTVAARRRGRAGVHRATSTS